MKLLHWPVKLIGTLMIFLITVNIFMKPEIESEKILLILIWKIIKQFYGKKMLMFHTRTIYNHKQIPGIMWIKS